MKRALLLSALLAGSPSVAMQAPPLHPFEAAWQTASLVVSGSVIDFERGRGLEVRVESMLRGTLPQASIEICDTGQALYLDRPGAHLVVFIAALQDSGCARLVYPPGAGGVILDDVQVMDAIRQAYDHPRAALESAEPRMRLAAAWYLTAGSGANPADEALQPRLLEAALWGLEQASAETNQAALDVLRALDVAVPDYHPYHHRELKRKTAQALRERLGG